MTFTKKQPYLDTEDTLEEVDITRRQLTYWRDQGLIDPELGPTSKRYTERDIRLLKFLRRLIVEQGFPVELTRRIVESAIDEMLWEGADFDQYNFLSLDSGTPFTTRTLEILLSRQFGATASEEELRNRAIELMLLLFRLYKLRSADDEEYRRRRDQLLSVIADQDIAARIEWRGDSDFSTEFVLQPHLDEDYDVYHELVTRLGNAIQTLKPYEESAKAAKATPAQRKRFFSRQDIEAYEQAQASVNDIDDIPF
jgi:DNA-binding transcriptional MerR regulator